MIKAQVWGGHGRAVQCALTCLICMCENNLLYKGLLLVSHICGEKRCEIWSMFQEKNSWLLLPQGNVRLAPCHALDTLLPFAERGQCFKRRRVRGLEEEAAQKAGQAAAQQGGH